MFFFFNFVYRICLFSLSKYWHNFDCLCFWIKLKFYFLSLIFNPSEGPIATGGGEGDAHELCLDIFSKSSNLEKQKKPRKDSSLSASLESLELDDVDTNRRPDNNNSNIKSINTNNNKER